MPRPRVLAKVPVNGGPWNFTALVWLLANPAGLTDRQLEILRLVATGLSNAQIAQRLVVSPHTVDHNVSAILRKVRMPTRRDAAAWAAGFENKAPRPE